MSVRSYLNWIADLKRRYRATQITAAVAANSAMLEFYWTNSYLQQLAEDNGSADYRQQVADDTDMVELMKVPWGQLGFYMVAADRQLKNEWDAPTVGLVLCRDGNRTVVEYALSVTDKPMGVAKYRLTQKAPKELSSMKCAVAKLGTVVDETIADAERQIAEAKKGNGK